MLKCPICNAEGAQTCSACKNVAYCSKAHQKEHWKQHKSQCRPFDIKSNKELGKHLVANRQIPTESVIISEGPLAFGPKISGASVLCLGCYQPVDVKTAEKCPRCKWPICGTTCLGIIHQSHHLPECILMSVNTAPAENDDLLYEAILPIRCLLLQKKNKNKWQQLLSLESHVEKRPKKSEGFRDFEKIAKYLSENYLDRIDSEALQETSKDIIHVICGIIEINAIEIPMGTGEVSSLYSTSSLLEHSCTPNTRFNFQLADFKINVMSTCDIEPGQHISTMYTHMLWGTAARREHLKHTKFFLCHCQRCMDPTELGTYMSALKCVGTELDDPTAPCHGFILPTSMTDDLADWKCSICPAILTSAHVSELMSRISADVDATIECPTVKKLEGLLEKLEKLLHKNHYHCFMVKHSLIQLYGRENGYSMEQLSNEILQRKTDLCRDLLAIIKTVDGSGSRIFLYTAVVLVELNCCLVEMSRRAVKSDDPCNELTAGSYLVEASNHLTECLKILKYEPPFSTGHAMLNIAKSHLVTVNSELKKLRTPKVD